MTTASSIPKAGKWVPVFVLPNIFVNEPIGENTAAIANCNDSRVQQILADIPVLAEFTNRFSRPFGGQFLPSMMIMRENAPKTFFTVEAVSSFRDLVAMCIIPLSRARSAEWGRSFATYYSDWYDFYPWMINTHHQHLVCSTPAVSDLEVVTDFNGQCDPGLSPVLLEPRDIDAVLMKILFRRWESHYKNDSRKWANVALFRSLNSAVAASKMPATVDVTLFDLGRSVSLWISAFEILAHPKIGKSGLVPVYDLLDKAPWHDKKLQHKRYRAFISAIKARQRGAPLRSLPCWLYGELYHARNDFLHGNPISKHRLHVKASGRSLFQYPPMLYRMALSAFLQAKINIKVPDASRTKAYAKYVTKYFEVFSDQLDIEKGIRTVLRRHRPDAHLANAHQEQL